MDIPDDVAKVISALIGATKIDDPKDDETLRGIMGQEDPDEYTLGSGMNKLCNINQYITANSPTWLARHADIFETLEWQIGIGEVNAFRTEYMKYAQLVYGPELKYPSTQVRLIGEFFKKRLKYKLPVTVRGWESNMRDAFITRQQACTLDNVFGYLAERMREIVEPEQPSSNAYPTAIVNNPNKFVNFFVYKEPASLATAGAIDNRIIGEGQAIQPLLSVDNKVVYVSLENARVVPTLTKTLISPVKWTRDTDSSLQVNKGLVDFRVHQHPIKTSIDNDVITAEAPEAMTPPYAEIDALTADVPLTRTGPRPNHVRQQALYHARYGHPGLPKLNHKKMRRQPKGNQRYHVKNRSYKDSTTYRR
jgi:hypothetical protein